MSEPYYSDESVTLYLGDCREINEWLDADVLVTDPPYGIAWEGTSYNGNHTLDGIANDADTSMRDEALRLWGDRPGVVFGTPGGALPNNWRQTLAWAKPPDSGIFGAFGGWRRDWEAIYLTGRWKVGPAARSGVLRSNVGSLAVYTKRGHPHSKPLDVMESLIAASPAGIVADPFAGSGSTLVAARAQGRRAVGVELEERYCEVTAKRLAQGVLA
jgi:DNA modification methylase